MNANPKYKGEIPYCSQEKCPMYISRAESGWGIYIDCIPWNEEKHGKKPRMYTDTVICRPTLLKGQ